jgi:hypothetical protein
VGRDGAGVVSRFEWHWALSVSKVMVILLSLSAPVRLSAPAAINAVSKRVTAELRLSGRMLRAVPRQKLRVEFLHSRLMCWVAFDRAIRLARKRALPAPLVDWTQTRDAIYHDIHTIFWDPQQRAFVQSRGSKALDASCLLMPLMRCISPTDPRWFSTLKAVGDQLRDDSLIYRYSGETAVDGLPGVEGTFNMCSFWYVECLARAGDVKQARFLFEKMLSVAASRWGRPMR